MSVPPSSGKRRLLTNHNRCWIWGRHAVWETVKAGKWPILQLLADPDLRSGERRHLEHLAAAASFPLEGMDSERIATLCRAPDHQGLAAKMGEFPYVSLADFLATLPSEPRLILVDRIQDSQNFGAIIRSVEGLGLHGILLGRTAQAGVNSLVARSSAGAVNHVPLVRCDSLTAAVQTLRQRGVHWWAASEKATLPVWEADLSAAVGIMIGNEGEGVCPELLELCAGRLQIPMQGHVGSLNAAVSAGILCYELQRQAVQRPGTSC